MSWLLMEGITRYYYESGVIANSSVDFVLERGEIHALVGENGAGKTTLMKILYGLEKRDSGKIYLDGREITVNSPLDANRFGIGMVRQHFRLIPEFTVAENCVLGMEPVKKWGRFDREKAVALVDRVIAENGFEIRGRDRVGSLPVGKQQQTAIVRMLIRDDKILILDEPTSVLTDKQRDSLFATMKSLVKKGKSVILITHKIAEVKYIADRITVMRKGKIKGIFRNSDINETELSRIIVGNDRTNAAKGGSGKKIANSTGKDRGSEPVFELKNVCLTKRGIDKPLLDNISLKIGRGEIVGVTGVSGNGLAELEDTVSGLVKISDGGIFLGGRSVTELGPAERRKSRLAYVPADRMRRGVSMDSTMTENMIIVQRENFFKYGIFNRRKADIFSRKLKSRFNIDGNPGIPVKYLSGGNIQKVILSRELSTDSDFIMFSKPAWGLDSASSGFVYRRITECAERGKGVLLMSTNPDEIMLLSDRIIVLYQGRIAGTFVNDGSLTKELLGDYMLGLESDV